MELEDIKRLVVHPGEIVVIKVPFKLTEDLYSRLKEQLKKAVKTKGIEVIILEQGIDLEVVTKTPIMGKDND